MVARDGIEPTPKGFAVLGPSRKALRISRIPSNEVPRNRWF